MTGIDAGRRALALIAIGDTARAEAELRALALRGSSVLQRAIVALADRANLASLSVELAGAFAEAEDRTATARSSRCRAGRRAAASRSTARCSSR